MSLPIRLLLAARRGAVADGEVRRMWPGAAADVVSLVWWRGIANPIIRQLHGPGPDERWHSPSGGCDLCNPPSQPTEEPT